MYWKRWYNERDKVKRWRLELSLLQINGHEELTK